MSVEIIGEAEEKDWIDFCDDLAGRFPHVAEIFAPMSDQMADVKVLKVSFPYGTPIISDGKFCWDSLPEAYREWAAAYSDIDIPLCLVTKRVVELHETAPFGEHSVPIHLLAEGEFFGLFQTFCNNLPQKRLRATSGGTSLIFLPRIGNRDVVRGWVKNAYAQSKKANYKRPWESYLDPHLKSDTTSGFYFGRFFSDLLYQMPSKWRSEVFLFPRSLVERIKSVPASHLAVLRIATLQLRNSYERAEEAANILGVDDVENTGHVLALRMIAHGLRPGFSPVFGLERDEDVLPASQIHEFFYGKTASFSNASNYYPTIFRPSMQNENPFYFLNWPYMKVKKTSKRETTASIIERAVTKAKQLEGVDSKSSLFEVVDRSLYSQHVNSSIEDSITMNVAIPTEKVAHYFIDGGMIIIRPHKQLSSSLL